MSFQIRGLECPWDTPPEATSDSLELRTIVPGVQWLCLPLPFALDHVNIWLLDDDQGTFVVDTSVQSSTSVALWEAALQRLPRAPDSLLVTHYHPDHIGLAGWFHERCSLSVLASEKEWGIAKNAWNATDENFSHNQDRWYQRHGLDEQRRLEMSSRGNSYRPLVSQLPSNPEFVQDGDELTIGGNCWKVMTVGGHAPDMICLYSEQSNVLMVADQVLPFITPNVSLSFYTEDPDPLGSFLASLDRFARLPADVLVLPSHGLPFRGLHQRIDQLKVHHAERLDALVKHSVSPQSATDMLSVLFRRALDTQQLMFAMGESIAHLNHLVVTGRLERVDSAGSELFVQR